MKNKNEIVQRFIDLITSSKEVKVVVENFLDLFREFFHYSSWAVLILDEDTDQFNFLIRENISIDNMYEIKSLIEEGIVDWTIERETPVFVPLNGKNLHFLIVPLKVNRIKVGVVVVICSIKENHLMQEEIDLFSSLSRQLAFFIDNSRLRKKLKHKKKEKVILTRLSQIVNSTQSVDELLRFVLDLILEETESEYGFILKLAKGSISPWISSRISLSKIKGCPFSPEKGAVGYIVSTGRPLIIDDYKKDVRFSKSGEFTHLLPSTALGIPMKIRGERIGILFICNKSPFYTNYDLDTALTVTAYTSMAVKNRFLYDDLRQSFLETVRSLIQAIEAKDKYTSGHSRMVTKYSLSIGRYLKLSAKDMEMIKFCGLLHDIGKIGISESILGKPSPLTKREYELIKRHPVIGEQIVRQINFLKDGLPLIRHHHERYDGKGYPDGLSGDNIPLLARILSVADAFDAMTSDRPYRKAMSVKDAIRELIKGKGTQFDPKIVDVFCRILEEKRFNLSFLEMPVL